MRNLVCVVAVVGLVGCATASKDVPTTYVSPLQYQGYDCGQLGQEQQRIQVRANQLAGRLDEANSNDKVITGVGAIIFWPALFALGGTKQQEQEFSRLKGESDAINHVAVQKRCNPQAAAVLQAVDAAASTPTGSAQ